MDVGLIVTIVGYVLFALIIGLAFLIGYKRGVKRSLLNLVVTFVMIVLAFAITPPVSNAILNISVNAGGTAKPLSQIIVDYLAQIEMVNDLINSSSSFATFLKAVPSLLMNIVVFYILYLIVRLLAFIVYKILQLIFMKTKDKDKKKIGLSKKSKLFGGLIGVAKGFAFIFLTLAPLTAVVGLVEDFGGATKSAFTSNANSETQSADSSDGLKTTQELLESAPKELTDAVSGYNKTPLGFFGSLFGLDNIVFDQLVKINVDGESIYLRQDILDYVTIYNTYVELSRAIENPSSETLKNLDWERMDALMNKVFESGLIKGVVANLVGDYITSYDPEVNDLGEFSDIVIAYQTAIKDKDIKEYLVGDLKKVYTSISVAGKEGLLDSLLFDKDSSSSDKVNGLLVAKNKEHIKTVVSYVLDMNLIKDGFSPILDLVVSKIDEDTFNFNEPSTEVVDWNAFKEKTLSLVEDIIDVNTLTTFTDLISDPAILLESSKEEVDALFTEVGELFENANNIGVLTDKDGNKIVDRLFINLELENILSVQNENIDGYDDLLNYAKEPFKNLIDLEVYPLIKDGKSYEDICDHIAIKLKDGLKIEEGVKTYSPIISDIILPLYKSDAFRDKFMEDILSISESVEFIDFNSLEVYEDEEYKFDKSYANWALDLKYITALFTELKLVNVGSGETAKPLFDAIIKDKEDFSEILESISPADVSSIALPAFYAKSLTALVEDIFDNIESSVRGIAEDDSIVIDPASVTFEENNKEDQAVEIVKILEKLIEYMPEGGYKSMVDLSKTELGIVLNLVKENAYRTNLSAKTEEGLFKDTFEKLYEQLKEDYPDVVDIIGERQPYEIDYKLLLSVVDSIEKAVEGTFIATLGDLIEKEDVTTEDITDLVDTITESTESLEKEEINNLLDQVEEFEVKVEIPGETEEEKSANEQTIVDALENNQNIDEETKNKIKNLLGITA